MDHCHWQDPKSFTSCTLEAGHGDQGWHLVGETDYEIVRDMMGNQMRVPTFGNTAWVYDEDYLDTADEKEAIESIKKSMRERAR
jgi:hypothetical protein